MSLNEKSKLQNELKLAQMNAEQFAQFREFSCGMYARLSPHFRDMPFEVALDLVLSDFDKRFAPLGVASSGQFFLAIYSGSDQIGYFHFGEFPKGSKSVFGWHFHIFENHQRKGWGRKSAELAKRFLRERGYDKIAINVVIDNEIAIKIYRFLGFKVTQLSMEANLI